MNFRDSKFIGNLYGEEQVSIYYDMIGRGIDPKSEDDKYLISILPNNLRRKAVLDIGCGNGRFSELFCNLDAEEVIAFDLSGEMIAEAAKRKSEKKLKQLDLIRADINDMPFASQQFDLVFARFSLMYGRNLNHVIGKIGQIIKDGGEVYALTNVAFVTNSDAFKGMKDKPVPLELAIGGKKIRLLNYPQRREDYQEALMKANLIFEDERYFAAIGLSVAPEYERKNEIAFRRGVFKLSKG